MANNSAQFNLGIKTSADLSGVNQIKKALEEVRKIASEGSGFFDVNEIKQMTSAANTLERALNGAFDVRLNTVNIAKFNDILKQSNTSITQIQNGLSYAGAAGQKAFLGMTSQLFKVNSVMKQSNTFLTNFAKTVGNTIRYQAINSALQNITNGVSQAYGYVKSLDTSLNNIQIVTEKNADSMARFAKEANKAAQSLGAKTTDYTDASLIYYQQGLNDSEVKGRTDTTMKMANVLGASADEVSQYMTAIWNNFDNGSKSLEYYGDVITSLGAHTASSAEEIAQGLEKFASVAETTGLSYEYATAALATVTAETRQSADVVGTAFKTLFARIQDLELGDEGSVSIGKYAEALDKVGIQVLDVNGNLKEMDAILNEMGSKWDSLSKSQQTALAQNVGGTRQYPQLIALMENWDKVKENIQIATDATGTLEDKQAIYMESTAAHLKASAAAWENFFDSMLNKSTINTLADASAILGNGMANFADSVGGIIPMLTSLGATGMRVFSAEIGQALSGVINSFKIFTDSSKIAQQNMAGLREMLGGNTWAGTMGVAESGALTSTLNQMQGLYSEIVQYGSVMNAQQKGHYEGLVNELNLIGYEKIEIEDIVSELSSLSGQANNPLFNTSLDEQGIEKIKALSQTAAELNSRVQGSVNLVLDLNMGLKDLPSDTAASLNSVFDSLENELKDNTSQASKLYDALSKVKGVSVQNGKFSIGDDFDKNSLERVKFLISNFSQYNQKLAALGPKLESIESRERMVADAGKAMSESLSLGYSIQQITKVTGALGQLAIGIQSIVRLPSIWNNEDLSTGEKLLQTITNFSFVLPNLIAGLSGLNNVLGITKLLNAAILLQKGTEEKLTESENAVLLTKIQLEKKHNLEKEKGLLLDKLKNAKRQAIYRVGTDAEKQEEIIQTIEAAIAEKDEALSHLMNEEAMKKEAAAAMSAKLAKMGLVAVVIAITAAVVAGAKAWYDYNKSISAEGKAESTEKALSNITTQLNDVKSSAKEIYDTFDKYNSLIETLNNCTVGTQDWKNALQDVKENINEILTKYPDLLQYSNLFNTDGTLNQNVLTDYENNQNQIVQNLQRAQLFSSAVNTQAQTELDKSNLANSMAKGITLTGVGSEGEVVYYEKRIAELISQNAEFLVSNTTNEFKDKITNLIAENFGNSGIDINEATDYFSTFITEVNELGNEVKQSNNAMKNASALMFDTIDGDYNDTVKALAKKSSISAITTKQDDIEKKYGDFLSGFLNANEDELAKTSGDWEKYLSITGQQLTLDKNALTSKNGVRGISYNNGEGFLPITEFAEVLASAEITTRDLEKALLEAKENIQNINKKVGNEKIANGISEFLVSGNLESLTEKEYGILTNQVGNNSKKFLKETLGSNWTEEYQKQFDEALNNYATALTTFTESLKGKVKDAFDKLNTDDLSLAEQKAVTNMLTTAFQKNGFKGLNELTDFTKELSPDELVKFANNYNSIDWNNITVEDFKNKMSALGIVIPAANDKIQELINKLKDLSGIDISATQAENSLIRSITDGLKQGSSIEPDKYNQLPSQLRESFGVNENGQYTLLEDTDIFQQAVTDYITTNLQNALNNLINNKDLINQLSSNYSDFDIIGNNGYLLSENRTTGQINFANTKKTKDQLNALYAAGYFKDNQGDYEQWLNDLETGNTENASEMSKFITDYIGNLTSAGIEESINQAHSGLASSAANNGGLQQLSKYLSQGLITQRDANKFSENAKSNDINKYGLKAETVNEITKKLIAQNKELKENTLLLNSLAIAQARSEKGVKSLVDTYDKFTKYTKKGKASWEDIEKAMNLEGDGSGFSTFKETIREGLSDIFNTDKENISDSFMDNNFKTISNYITARTPELRNQFYTELLTAKGNEGIFNFAGNDSEIRSYLLNEIDTLKNEIAEIGPIDLADLINSEGLETKLNEIIAAVGGDAETLQSILNSIGYDADIVPETKEVVISGKYNGSQFEAERKTIQWFKIVPKGENAGTNTYYPDTGSSKGGGGSSKSDKKAPNEYWEEFDENYDLNQAIDVADKKLKNLKKKSSKQSGKELAANLKEQNRLLDEQKASYEKLIAAKKEKMKTLQKEINQDEILQKLGEEARVEFDESGLITNYAEATKAAYEKYLLAYEMAKGAEKDAIIKEYEHYKKLLKEYNVVLDEIDDTELKIDDAEYEKIENNFKAWEAEIQLKLDLENAQQDWYEFLRKMNTDFRLQYTNPYQATFGMVEQAESIAREIGINIGAMEDIGAEIDKFMAGGESDMFHSLSEAQTEMGNYLDQMMAAGEELYDLAEEAWDIYIQIIDEIAEQFEDIIKKFERINESLEHNIKLTELLYGDDSYDKLSDLYEAKVYNDALELDSYRQQVAFWEKETQIAKQLNGEDSEDYYKMYNHWQEAIANLESQIEKAIEDLQAQIESKIDGLFSNIEQALTKGWGYQGILDEWDSVKSANEGNYDEIERIYQLQSLQNKWNELLKDNNTVKVQQKLADVMAYQLETLTNKATLTEKDIELAEKQLEVAKAQAALEDAQNAKQSMKLVRGTDGNWSYQYVADVDEVTKKQQEALDAQNEMYESSKESLAETLEDMMNMIKEYNEQLTELYKQWYKEEDPTKRAALEAQIAGLQDRLASTAANSLDEIEYLSTQLGNSSSSLLYSLYNAGDLSGFTDETLDFVTKMLDEGVNSWSDFSSAASKSFNTIAVDGLSLAEKLSGLFGDNTQLGQFFNDLSDASGINLSTGNNRTENQALVDSLSTILGATLTPAVEDLADLATTYWNTVGELTQYAGYDFTNIDAAIEKNVNATYALKDDTEAMVKKGTEYLTYMQKLTATINAILNRMKPQMFAAGNSALNAMGVEGNLYEEAKANQNAMIAQANSVANGYIAEMKKNGESKTAIDDLAINLLRNAGGSLSSGAVTSITGLGTTSIPTSIDNEYDTYIKTLTSSIGNALQTSVATMVADITKSIIPSGVNSITNNNGNVTYNVEANFPNADDVSTIQEAILSLPNIVSQYINR